MAWPEGGGKEFLSVWQSVNRENGTYEDLEKEMVVIVAVETIRFSRIESMS